MIINIHPENKNSDLGQVHIGNAPSVICKVDNFKRFF